MLGGKRGDTIGLPVLGFNKSLKDYYICRMGLKLGRGYEQFAPGKEGGTSVSPHFDAFKGNQMSGKSSFYW